MNYRWMLGVAAVGWAVWSGNTSSALAAQFFAERDNVRFTSPVDDDVYGLGEEIELGGSIAQDVAVAARTILITAPIDGDFMGAASTIDIQARVGDDVFAAGERIEARSEIRGDAFMAGREVSLEPDSVIAGDAFVAAEHLTVRGNIQGDLKVAGQVLIGREAVIDGSVISYGTKEGTPVIESGATIGGSQRHYAVAKGRTAASAILLGWVRAVMTLFFLSLILLYGFPKLVQLIQVAGRQAPLSAFLTGVVWSFLWIPLAVFLLVIGIGWRVSVILAGVTAAGYMVAMAVFAILLGEWLMRKISRSNQADWTHALLGAMILQSVQLLGGLGWILAWLGGLVVFGALVIGTWKSLRSR